MDFVNGFRFGMPFFLPIDYYDTRIQILDNVSYARGNHFFKLGAEWNRVNSVQTFVGFPNSRYIFSSVTGFLNYVANDSLYVECRNNAKFYTRTTGACDPVPPPGAPDTIVGPVLLYLQQAGVDRSVRDAGTQSIPQNEVALYIQDSWKPDPRWTINYGLRWEAQIEPDPITPPASVFYSVYFDSTVTTPRGRFTFPSTIPASAVFLPSVFVFDKNFRNPRTFSATVGYERQIGSDLGVSLSYTHARTDHLTRFFNANDPVFNNDTIGPWGTGPRQLGTLTVVQSTAKSRYNGVTVGLKHVFDPRLQFQLNYTISFDKSDDDNERDPFTVRDAKAHNLGPEYNWSDRDQRHRFNGWALVKLPGDFYLNNRVSYYSAQPVSEKCGAGNVGNGQRAGSPQDRICPNGSVLKRNTLRQDNAYFSWDVRLSRPINAGRQAQAELIVEVFNLTNTDNFRDPAYGGLLFNFDGTIRSGLGDPRQLQAGLRWVF